MEKTTYLPNNREQPISMLRRYLEKHFYGSISKRKIGEINQTVEVSHFFLKNSAIIGKGFSYNHMPFMLPSLRKLIQERF